MHWWPSHDLIFTVTGFDPARDFQSLEQFLKLFKPETRGAPKISEVKLIEAIQRLEPHATQSAVAKDVGVTPRTLQRWASKIGLKDWDSVRRRYEPTVVEYAAQQW